MLYGTPLISSGPDLDDDDDGGDVDGKGDAKENGKPKTPQQRTGEAMIKHILEEVDGACYSFELVLSYSNTTLVMILAENN